MPTEKIMKSTYIYISAVVVLCCNIKSAYASDRPLTLKECSRLSSEINKNVPMVIDTFTTLDSTFCTPGRLKPILNYRALMGALKSKLHNFESGLIEMRRQQTNSWCTDPEQLNLIRRVDILNLYYDSDRVFVGQILLKHGDCATKNSRGN